jgi:5-methylcytosine-specific restriction enzyme A
MAGSRARSIEAAGWQKLYSTAAWRSLRKLRLALDPLCKICAEADKLKPASVCDHIKPHRGDLALFYDFDNTQSLCAPCHDSVKQREERLGYSPQIGGDGWPLDDRHPVNARR